MRFNPGLPSSDVQGNDICTVSMTKSHISSRIYQSIIIINHHHNKKKIQKSTHP